MPEFGKNLWESIEETAARKQRAGQARFNGVKSDFESPREIYRRGCAAIGKSLSALGYQYLKSSQTLKRKSGIFAYEIRFQSSMHNIHGELVALWIHANVKSPSLEKWRVDQSIFKNSFVAGGQIGNLSKPYSWMEWNLASPDTFDEQITDAVSTIERLAFPYFAMFEDVPSLVDRLMLEEIPSFMPSQVIQFIMCFGTKEQAIKAATNMLRTLNGALEIYEPYLARLRADGLPHHQINGNGEVLAEATIRFGFPNLTELL